MNIFKKIAFLFVVLTLLCSNIIGLQAQDEPNADQTAERKVFLPLVADKATMKVFSDTELASVPTSGQGEQVVSKIISAAEQRSAMSFWTRKAIAAAQPMEMPSQAGDAEVDAAAIAHSAATGPRGFAAGGRPARGADAAARAAYPFDWAMLEADAEETVDAASVLAPDGTSQIYSSYFVNTISSLQTLYPHTTMGRISFSTSAGTSYCSGTSISGNVLLTAAHCLYDSTANVWYSNWVFTPAYRNGAAPYGTFPATQCWVLTAWINLSGSYAINSWAPYDVGVCKMGTNSSGTTLNNAVGWMGRQWNDSYTLHLHDFGYPFRNTSDVLITNAGLYLHACVSESFQQTTEVRGMGCDMSRGKSGGPLVVGYAPNVVTGWVNGVYSGFFIGTANLYAGRFNSNNIVVLCNSAVC